MYLVVNCNRPQRIPTIERNRILMGTFVTITVYDNKKSSQEIEQIIDLAFNEIEKIDRLASNWSDSSAITSINQKASEHFVEVDSNLAEIINQSQQLAQISDGAFDISIFPLMELWNFHDSSSHLPNENDLKDALRLVNHKDILLSQHGIKFNNQGMKIDLGGIAKGYAVDKAMDVLIKYGIKDALVNAGGDFKAICSKLTQGKRKVWIRHPRKKDSFFGYFDMDSGSVATSGDYEQFFMVDSIRYHHILNPKTGYPANKCVSVTIRAKNTTIADALATAVFVLGPQKGMQLIDRLDGVEGVIIFEKDKILQYIVSRGLTGKFHAQLL